MPSHELLSSITAERSSPSKSNPIVYLSADPDIAADMARLDYDCQCWTKGSQAALVKYATEVFIVSSSRRGFPCGSLDCDELGSTPCLGRVAKVVVPGVKVDVRDLRTWAETEGNNFQALIESARANAVQGKAKPKDKAKSNGEARQRRWKKTADGGDPDGRSQAHAQVDVLLELAAAADLFHATDGRPYAKVLMVKRKISAGPGQAETTVPEHHEVHGIKGTGFKSWSLFAYFAKTNRASAALSTAIRTLEAKACCQGEERTVFVRVGVLGDRRYIDLETPPAASSRSRRTAGVSSTSPRALPPRPRHARTADASTPEAVQSRPYGST